VPVPPSKLEVRRRRQHRVSQESAPIAKELRINDRIFAPAVRVIRDGDQLGVMTVPEALRLAEEANLDLVEVAAQADPPVVRIMDYGKFKYEQAKRERESRRGSKQVQLREVRMKVKIDQHDIDFKARTARKLLDEGDKVKVSVMFRAREITHPEVGRDLLERFMKRVEDVAVRTNGPGMEGRFMSMILEPARKPATRDEKVEAPAEAEAVTGGD
jgi:translation initiation factor IF-3